MFGSTTCEFKGCALALSDVRCLSEEKILRCQRAMRTLNNAGAVELTIYLVKMPVRRRRDRFCQNPNRGQRFRSDFLNIWRCSFAFNASHLPFPSLLHRWLFGNKSADRTRIFTWGRDLQSPVDVWGRGNRHRNREGQQTSRSCSYYIWMNQTIWVAWHF